MPLTTHRVTIDLAADDAGNFQVTGTQSTLDLQPAQLGLILLKMVETVLRGQVTVQQKPLIEIPAMALRPGPGRSM